MGSATSDDRYRYFVAIYRCDVLTSGPTEFVCDDVKVEVFREERTYAPSEFQNAVVAVVLNAEYCFPSHLPIHLDTRCQHLVLTTRSKSERSAAQTQCEAKVDRVVTILSAIATVDLFRTLLFRGWLQGGPPSKDLGFLVKWVPPVEVNAKTVSGAYVGATGAIARQPQLQERFALMARFVAKGLAEPPGEEAFVWLWTALEIFPMVGTTDIKPIASFLSGYVSASPEVVKEKLKVGWLFGMRSKMVHDGHLPLEASGKLSALGRLESLVRAVVRHAAGLPYDGALDHQLGRK